MTRSYRAPHWLALLLLAWCCCDLPAQAQTVASTKPSNSPPMSAFIGSAVRDPLENYYDNTLVCAAAQTGQDLCHLWLYRDGSFINFDGNAAHTGHYSVGPVRADGKVPVCQYWDSAANVNPSELITPMGVPTNAPPQNTANAAPQPAPAAAPAAGPTAGSTAGPTAGMGAAPAAGGMICKTENFRSTCYRGVEVNSLSAEDKKMVNLSMGERFYNGLCYPLGPHNVGDMWFEDDDPLPGQLGLDRMFLLPGRQ